MMSYAEREIFTTDEIALQRRAAEHVAQISHIADGREVRCHELARAVGRVLGLYPQDGKFGRVDHTWLWTRMPSQDELGSFSGWAHDARPRILDVYTPGVVPQVTLIDTWVLLPTSLVYNIGDPRDDIRWEVVDYLEGIMR